MCCQLWTFGISRVHGSAGASPSQTAASPSRAGALPSRFEGVLGLFLDARDEQAPRLFLSLRLDDLVMLIKRRGRFAILGERLWRKLDGSPLKDVVRDFARDERRVANIGNRLGSQRAHGNTEEVI